MNLVLCAVVLGQALTFLIDADAKLNRKLSPEALFIIELEASDYSDHLRYCNEPNGVVLIPHLDRISRETMRRLRNYEGQ